MSQALLVDRAAGVATLTLNRPHARNALDAELLTALRDEMRAADADDDIAVIVLTGTDPAFCAGLDLKQLGGSAENLTLGGHGSGPQPWAPPSKPVIGAINGAAVTGGLELALNCDVLVASENARFADTHARIGVMPGWGMSVLLPQIVGRGLARRMSLTGEFLSASDAHLAGLVTEVVPHEQLPAAARRIADTIAETDRHAARTLLDSYRRIELAQLTAGYEIASGTARCWLADDFDPSAVEGRRQALLERAHSPSDS